MAERNQIKWTEELLDFVRKNWQTMTDVEMAEFLTRVYGERGFSKRTLEHIRARLGLIKYEIPANKKKAAGRTDKEAKLPPGLMGAWINAAHKEDAEAEAEAKAAPGGSG